MRGEEERERGERWEERGGKESRSERRKKRRRREEGEMGGKTESCPGISCKTAGSIK